MFSTQKTEFVFVEFALKISVQFWHLEKQIVVTYISGDQTKRPFSRVFDYENYENMPVLCNNVSALLFAQNALKDAQLEAEFNKHFNLQKNDTLFRNSRQ